MKKILAWTGGIAVVFVVFVIAALFFHSQGPSENVPGYKCPFCDRARMEKQSYYEGELVRVILNYRPIIKGHTLIMPKRHVVKLQDLTEAEFAEIGRTIKKVQKAFQQVYGAADFLLLVQDGENAGQTVFHVHFHMLPRAEQSLFTKMALWGRMMLRPFDGWSPIDWTGVEQQRLLLQEAIQKPLIQEGVQKPFQEGVQKTLIQEGIQKTLIQEGVQKTLIQEGIQKTFQEGVQKTLIQEGMNPLEEGVQKPLIQEGVQKTLIQEGIQKTLIQEGIQKPLIQEA